MMLLSLQWILYCKIFWWGNFLKYFANEHFIDTYCTYNIYETWQMRQLTTFYPYVNKNRSALNFLQNVSAVAN